MKKSDIIVTGGILLGAVGYLGYLFVARLPVMSFEAAMCLALLIIAISGVFVILMRENVVMPWKIKRRAARLARKKYIIDPPARDGLHIVKILVVLCLLQGYYPHERCSSRAVRPSLDNCAEINTGCYRVMKKEILYSVDGVHVDSATYYKIVK